MKRNFFLFLLIFSESCSKLNITEDPIGPPPGDPTGPTILKPGGGSSGGSVTIYSCTSKDVPTPTNYTFTDVYLAESGYGIFSNLYYDKGWTAGYKDALYYLSYYYIPSANNCSTFSINRIVDSSGTTKVVPMNYILKAGEYDLRLAIKLNGGGCVVDWSLIKCVLWNEIESKTLRLQYQYNKDYTGYRTDDEIQFDNGRYDGFIRGITEQPLTP
ncbi:MAG: hypothetical protein JWO92_1247 [Chitinophagaceae bacterium]|nr:hypothetical protein [Chitinophagaceae bacterium]